MINSNKHHQSSHHASHLVRTLLLLPVAGVFLMCSSCKDDVPVRPTYTDTKPVGDGLAVIGFSVVGAAVVIVLGKLLR